jgi:DNA-binding NtrC family response regulator
MKADLNDLKKLTLELMAAKPGEEIQKSQNKLIKKLYSEEELEQVQPNSKEAEEETREVELLPSHREEDEQTIVIDETSQVEKDKYDFAEEIQEEETLSLQQKEIELIKKALERNKGKRKLAAAELGISERTLYRKIKQYDL